MTPQFEISPLFGDGAVLCRDREIRLFGTAPEGAAVTAELRDRFGRVLGKDTAPAREGRFLLRLPPQTAQEECTLTYACGGASVVCTDVVIGDVYLAGGQSNMELELQNADEGPGLIETHDLPLVRYFNVPKCARPGPETEQANRAAPPSPAGWTRKPWAAPPRAGATCRNTTTAGPANPWRII